MIPSRFRSLAATFLAPSLLILASCSRETAPLPPTETADEDVAPEDTSPPVAATPRPPPAQAESGLLKEPPSGNYRVTRTSLVDTCSPKQTATGTSSNGVVSRFHTDCIVANVPAVLGPEGSAIGRIDLELTQGFKIEKRTVPCGEGTTSTFRATVMEVGATSFTINVERAFTGVESCAADTRPRVPAASCATVEQLRFELDEKLCSARCRFEPVVLPSGGLGGDCNCGRQRNH